MNKYQLAAFSLAGRNLGKKLIEGWADPWGYDRNQENISSDDPIDDEKGRKEYFKYLDPDSAMGRYGDSSKFTAFIYSDATNTLFCQPGDQYHSQGLHDGELAPAFNEKKNNVFLFGRFGKSQRGGGFVTIWGTAVPVVTDDDGYDNDYANSYNGLRLGDEKVLKKMLVAMVQGSAKIKGTSPAEYPITTDYIFTNANGDINTVGELIGQQGSTDNPCSKIARINVRGRAMDLGQVLANLHMVKGQDLDQMKNAICSDYERLKEELTKSGCQQQLRVLSDIWARMGGCPDNREAYNKLKRQGASSYRADLRKIFSDPDKIDTEFRGRQKDIDDAWDFLVGRKEHFSYGYYINMLMESRR